MPGLEVKALATIRAGPESQSCAHRTVATGNHLPERVVNTVRKQCYAYPKYPARWI